MRIRVLGLGVRLTVLVTFAVFFIHSWTVRVDPLRMIPAVPGTPAWVSNSLINFSPTAVLFRFAVWIAALATSGPIVLSCLRFVVLDGSL